MTDLKPTRAAAYARISLDPSGETLGVRRQLEAIDKWAQRNGWTIGHRYVDNDISASKPELNRPEYNRMVEAIAAGQVDGVIAVAADRLSRQMGQLVNLLDICAEKKIQVATTSGEMDLSSASGIAAARMGAVFASMETQQKAERQILANRQRLHSGRAYGRKRSFGYLDRAKTALHPEEAPAIARAAEDYLSGVTTTEIADRLNLAGLLPDSGNTWTTSTIGALLKRPDLAGVVTYKGQELPEVEAQWPAILTKGTHDRLVAALTKPDRVVHRRPAQRYVLSGLLTCGRCGNHMRGGGRKEFAAYVCADHERNRCGLAIMADIVEPIVLDYVRGRLHRLTSADVLNRDDVAESAHIVASLREIEAERIEVMEMELSAKTLATVLDKLERRETTLRASLAKLSKSSILSSVVAKAMALDDLSAEQKRLIIGQLARVTVMPGHGTKRVIIQDVEPMHGGLRAPEGLVITGDSESWEPADA